ncbi:hypothetical protein GW17_00015852 [Ensete ventricosum]|nr:hypothetical protein GW17_00015852 [Ensete ventricosum]
MRPVAELLRSVAAFAGPRYRVAQHVEVSSLPPSPSINAIGRSPVHPSRPLTPRLRHAPRSKLLTWVGTTSVLTRRMSPAVKGQGALVEGWFGASALLRRLLSRGQLVDRRTVRGYPEVG